MLLLDWFLRARRGATQRIALALPETTRLCPHCGTALPREARYCFMCGEKLDSRAEAEGGAASPALMSGRAIAEVRERLAGQLAGRYAIRELIGAGGMGLVFRADDVALERPVAIKVLPPEAARDAVVVARFQREARTAARLDHPNIVPIYAVESAGGLHYFIMKFVAGRTLHQPLQAGAAPFPIVVRVMRDAAAGLAHAHARGIVHRDVKPGNIILDQDGHAILTDFGISKALRGAGGQAEPTQLTEAGNIVGTPHYMAPEQALGMELDGRTDQYSLAVIAFQLVTGVLPFEAESPHAIIHLHINEAPPPLATLRPEVPPAMAAAIARALAKSPDNRFGNIEEFAAALTSGTSTTVTRAAASASGTSASVARAVEIPAPREVAAPSGGVAAAHPSTRPPASLWTALLVLLLSSGMAWAAWDRSDAGPPPASANTIADSTSTVPATTHRVLLGVTSSPHATVYIDGAWRGETPLAGIPLDAERAHEIRVARAGYRTVRDTIHITGADPIHRGYVLRRQPPRNRGAHSRM